ncbi:hypothetical protein DPQ25_09600 [Hydrogeniiclostridium mannosilyticum]|uniref:Uncharacterized protein n=1 Tax=Hydrogeniiclostridium mannosilyticum TaxID=2764322 RepID=A0A328UAE2_9FIRM|nr:hypothetical protein DPQ25_09600 [Hydrogeniiclostridium mannosilyticum]
MTRAPASSASVHKKAPRRAPFYGLSHDFKRCRTACGAFLQPRANTGKAARVFHKRMLFQLKKKAAADIISKVPPLRPSAWV